MISRNNNGGPVIYNTYLPQYYFRLHDYPFWFHKNTSLHFLVVKFHKKSIQYCPKILKHLSHKWLVRKWKKNLSSSFGRTNFSLYKLSSKYTSLSFASSTIQLSLCVLCMKRHFNRTYGVCVHFFSVSIQRMNRLCGREK